MNAGLLARKGPFGTVTWPGGFHSLLGKLRPRGYCRRSRSLAPHRRRSTGTQGRSFLTHSMDEARAQLRRSDPTCLPGSPN